MIVNINTEGADYQRRLKVAENFAEWHLGDAQWANDILFAFLYPESAEENLRFLRERTRP